MPWRSHEGTRILFGQSILDRAKLGSPRAKQRKPLETEMYSWFQSDDLLQNMRSPLAGETSGLKVLDSERTPTFPEQSSGLVCWGRMMIPFK
jgi:hypothetical protein